MAELDPGVGECVPIPGPMDRMLTSSLTGSSCHHHELPYMPVCVPCSRAHCRGMAVAWGSSRTSSIWVFHSAICGLRSEGME